MLVPVVILKLSSGQPVKPRGVLVEKFAGLKMQLTAEQFAYRAFHARETRIKGLHLASPRVIFGDEKFFCDGMSARDYE